MHPRSYMLTIKYFSQKIAGLMQTITFKVSRNSESEINIFRKKGISNFCEQKHSVSPPRIFNS